MNHVKTLKIALINTWSQAWKRAAAARPALLLILATSILLLFLFQGVMHAAYSQLMLISSVITGMAAACCFFRLQKAHSDKRRFLQALPHCVLAVLLLTVIQSGIQSLVSHSPLIAQILSMLFILALAFFTSLTGPIIVAENALFWKGIIRSVQLLWRSPIHSLFTLMLPLSMVWLAGFIAIVSAQSQMGLIGLIVLGLVILFVVPFMLACWVVLYEQLNAKKQPKQQAKANQAN